MKNAENTVEMLAVNTFDMVGMVDNLVELRAKKAQIDKQVKELETMFKDMMKESGYKKACYTSLKNKVMITTFEATTTAWKSIAEHYGYSEYMFNKNSKTVDRTRLTVTARTKDAV